MQLHIGDRQVMVFMLNVCNPLCQGPVSLIVNIAQISHTMLTLVALHGLLRVPSTNQIPDRLRSRRIAVLGGHVIQNTCQLGIE